MWCSGSAERSTSCCVGVAFTGCCVGTDAGTGTARGARRSVVASAGTQECTRCTTRSVHKKSLAGLKDKPYVYLRMHGANAASLSRSIPCAVTEKAITVLRATHVSVAPAAPVVGVGQVGQNARLHDAGLEKVRALLLQHRLGQLDAPRALACAAASASCTGCAALLSQRTGAVMARLSTDSCDPTSGAENLAVAPTCK